MPVQPLILREHGTARIGERWDPAGRMLPAADAAALERLQARHGAEVISVGRRTVTATQWVGAVTVGRHTIEVLPKIDLDDGAVRANLLLMLAYSGLLPWIDLDVAAQAPHAHSLIEMVLAVYVRRLSAEWRRGRLRSYRKLDAQRTALRGKLLFAEQTRQNLVRPDRFYTRADIFDEDTSVSRLLKAGLMVALQFAAGPRLRVLAAELLSEFETVATIEPSAIDVDGVQVDRRHERFRPSVELARLLVRQSTPDRSGAVSTFSLLFDMNVLFEQFVGQLIRRRVCPPERRARLQAAGTSLLLRDGQGKFWLRPDVAVDCNGELQALLDTKWKRLDSAKPNWGVGQDDIYQAYAYGKEHACPLVVLLYPRTAELPAVIADYRHRPGNDGAPIIRIATVDLRPPSKVLVSTAAAELRTVLGW